MAKKNSPAAPASAPTVNMVLLKAIGDATAVAPGYMNVPATEAAPLNAAGLVQINPDLAFAYPPGNADMPAVRVSPAGTEMLAKAGGPAAAPAPAPAAPAKQTFNVIDFALPEAKRAGGGGARPEVYPFSTLEPGKAFFVPATKDKPEPWKTFASTVASATNRYKTDDLTKPERKNRKGRMVKEQTVTRQFAIRGPLDGTPFGFPGVQGAAVGRVK